MVKMSTPQLEASSILKAQIKTERIDMFFAPSKSLWTAKILILGSSTNIDHIHIIIMMANPNMELPVSLKPKLGLEGYGCFLYL